MPLKKYKQYSVQNINNIRLTSAETRGQRRQGAAAEDNSPDRPAVEDSP